MEEVKSHSRDELYAILLRMWMAGALYLLIAQGTSIVEMEGYSYFIPLIFFLGLGLMIAQRIMIDPIIKSMFKTRLNRQVKDYNQTKVITKVLYNLAILVLNMLLVAIIASIYFILNEGLDRIFNIRRASGIAVIPPDPIGFGLLYGLFYKLYEFIGDIFYKKKEEEKND